MSEELAKAPMLCKVPTLWLGQALIGQQGYHFNLPDDIEIELVIATPRRYGCFDVVARSEEWRRIQHQGAELMYVDMYTTVPEIPQCQDPRCVEMRDDPRYIELKRNKFYDPQVLMNEIQSLRDKMDKLGTENLNLRLRLKELR